MYFSISHKGHRAPEDGSTWSIVFSHHGLESRLSLKLSYYWNNFADSRLLEFEFMLVKYWILLQRPVTWTARPIYASNTTRSRRYWKQRIWINLLTANNISTLKVRSRNCNYSRGGQDNLSSSIGILVESLPSHRAPMRFKLLNCRK